jgi:hypothetical protein
VAMVVVLFPLSDEEPRLRPAALEELAGLGVTNVALLRDPTIAGLVLEGWAFDSSDAPRAACAVVGAREELQMLEPLVHMAVSTATYEGGRHVQEIPISQA